MQVEREPHSGDFGQSSENSSGGWVSNAWVTCLQELDNSEKLLLIQYKLTVSHDTVRKDLSLVDGPAFD